MSLKKITMRLYKRHDHDLIYLYRLKGFDFKAEVINVLRAYIHNEPYKIEYKKYTELNPDIPARTFQFHFFLDPKHDADIIEFFPKIAGGKRNNFIKMLMRNKAEMLITEPYLTENQNELKFVEENK